MKSSGWSFRKPRTTLAYDTLLRAKPEYVARLARSLRIQPDGKDHAAVCREIVRWYKRNPQPNPKNR